MRRVPEILAHSQRVGRLALPLVLGSAAGLLLRCLLFLLAARLLGLLARLLGLAFGLVPSADPVYTRAALQTFSDLTIGGLSVVGPLGSALHASFPDLFVASDRTAWVPIRFTVQPGSAVLARLIAATIAHTGVLAVGLVVVRRGLLTRRLALVVAGLAVQAQAALSVVAAPPKLSDLEATGLSFAVNALFPWLSGRRVAISDLFVGVPAPVLVGSLVALALVVDLVAAGVGASLAVAASRKLRRLLSGRVPNAGAYHPPARSTTLASALLAASLVLASGAAAGASLAVGGELGTQTAIVTSDPPAVALSTGNARPARHAAVGRRAGAGRLDAWWLDPILPEAPGSQAPSVVEIRGSGTRFEYIVNGSPQVVQGMGLNTQYHLLMTPDERAARLEADFGQMQAMGINTVLGWDPAEFDHTLFATAQAHGMGVIPPFDLDPETDFTDPTVRSALRRQVLAWVEAYQNEPSLRMWGLGNEVLHKIVHPSWLGPQDPARDRQARAFAAWLVETVDAIHAADPNHPVTYRSAEDAFVPWILDALRRAGGGPRPWFAFGTNCYSDNLADIVDNWPTTGGGLALWVSEFAPGGMAPPDRAAGFGEMWGYVRRHPSWVLGGAVYAWTRNGPEEIDRTMGLTDDGTPVDGGSIQALGALFAGAVGGDVPVSTP